VSILLSIYLAAWRRYLTGLFKTKTVISSTLAHSDFVKTLLVVPSLRLLVSGSSDRSVRFWSVPFDLAVRTLGVNRDLGICPRHIRPMD
jgi:WD40 repeat protein